jgi:hypothetical protein
MEKRPSRADGPVNGDGVMRKTIYAIAAAAAIAAVLVLLPSFAPQVEAHGPVLGAKGDRIDARPTGDKCEHEWPYFEASCLRDPRYPFGQARDVRIIPADRLPYPVQNTAVASR